MAMTPAERQKKRRVKLKQEHLKPLLVRGDNGKFDERILVALAVEQLAKENKLDSKFVKLIIEYSINVFPDTNKINQQYIRKIVTEFLEPEGERDE